MNEQFEKDFIYKVNMIAVLEDVQNQLIEELHPESRHNIRMMLGDCLKSTRRFVKACDKIFDFDKACNFGIVSDDIREMLDNKYLNK